MQPKASTSDPLQGLFLGTGHFAAIQLQAWHTVNGACIRSLHGRRAEAIAPLADRFDISSSSTDLNRLLAENRPDFADICTALEAHPAQIRALAEAGIPLLCQKPIAGSLAESEALVAACKARGVRIMIHDNWRWQPWYRELHALLRADVFGRVRVVHHTLRTGDGSGPAPYADQPYFRTMPRFLILETGIHYLDTYRFLFGEPRRIACRTQRCNPAIVGEDEAVISLEFEDGPIVIWDGNRAAPTPERKPPFNGTLRLMGEKASLDIDAQGLMWLTEPSGARHQHAYRIPEGYRGGSVAATLQHFVDCLRTGAEFETSGADYLKTMRLVFAAYESAESGCTRLL